LLIYVAHCLTADCTNINRWDIAASESQQIETGGSTQLNVESSSPSNVEGQSETLQMSREVVMAGDTNLFFNDSDDRYCAEIEVMIAEPGLRRGGLAFEALCLIIGYACEHLDVNKFVAKISEHNSPSLRLFEKLGFECTAPR
jgi:hypothetical protein